METVPERLAALRERLREAGLDWFLVPSADEHLDEYLPAWRERRRWLSGFSGSAGDLVVGREEAWLFPDGRDHLRAEAELAGSGIRLSRVGRPGEPTLEEFLAGRARGAPGTVVGADPMLHDVAAWRRLGRVLAEAGGELRPVTPNPVDVLWRDRPRPSRRRLRPVPPGPGGRSPGERLEELERCLEAAGADGAVLGKLDQVAWLLGLRSVDDVPYNPVFEAWGFVGGGEVHLFLRGGDARLPRAGWEAPPGLEVHDYRAFPGFLEEHARGRVLVDPEGVTWGVRAALERNPRVAVLERPHPVDELKAVKDPAEQAAMRRANLLASAAKTDALRWLAGAVAAGRAVSPARFRAELEARYAEVPGYWGLSFETIVTAGAESAVVHATGASEEPLRPGEWFLVDTGIHAAGGTTDCTRTVVVGGEASAEQRRVYTLVLKAHIAAAALRFPEGTPGSALDAACRLPLWRAGLDYAHGTGHGVGCLLNVHEGPFSLGNPRTRPRAVRPLRAGMVTSIEPGIYRPGWGGVRLENLYLLVPAGEDADGRTWLRLEPLTFVPFEDALVDRDMLEPWERDWYDGYQERVERESGRR